MTHNTSYALPAIMSHISNTNWQAMDYRLLYQQTTKAQVLNVRHRIHRIMTCITALPLANYY